MTVLKRIVCLANSQKKGGLCVAGKEVANGGIANWIRPISGRPGEEITRHESRYEDGCYLHVMDIVDVPIIRHRPNEFQSENWLMNSNKRWKKIGQMEWGELVQLVDPIEPLWNIGVRTTYGINNRMEPAIAHTISNSLRFLWVDALKVSVTSTDWSRRVDGKFQHSDTVYKLSIADPHTKQTFLDLPNAIYNMGGCFITVSVGELYRGYHYKLIATVIQQQALC